MEFILKMLVSVFVCAFICREEIEEMKNQKGE